METSRTTGYDGNAGSFPGNGWSFFRKGFAPILLIGLIQACGGSNPKTNGTPSVNTPPVATAPTWTPKDATLSSSKPYTFQTSATDIDNGDHITKFEWDFGDTTTATFTTTAFNTHSYSKSGIFSCRVRAYDTHNAPSAWASTLITVVPPVGTHMDIRTWVPPYDQDVWKAALTTNTGGTYSPSNTLTSVAAQFWHTNSDGTVFLDGPPTSDVQWVFNYCHTHGIKFMVCVTNYNDTKVGGEDFDWPLAALAFSNHKDTLINSLVSLVDQWGADGVDIDYESTGELTYQTEFATFIKELGTQLHSTGKALTVAVFPNDDCAPEIDWIGDWVGYVDGVESMGYGALAGGGSSNPDDSYWDTTYKGQQKLALDAGYPCYQFDMGMPGDAGTWGKGGLGTSLAAHLQELQSGAYNTQPTSVCIWDAEFTGDGWLSADTWAQLHAIRETTHP